MGSRLGSVPPSEAVAAGQPLPGQNRSLTGATAGRSAASGVSSRLGDRGLVAGVSSHRGPSVAGPQQGVRMGRSARAGSSASDDSTPGDEAPLGRAFIASSLPVHLFSYRDIKCPVCHKLIPTDDVECHLVMCLTRPRISYNEDVLTEDKGECIICLEELRQGDTIARLPCLCIYHKGCIDEWFKVNRSCPEHPD